MILGVTLSQNLFTAGRATSAVQGAAAARTSADIGLDAARAQVALDVAQAYFNAVASDKLVEIEDSTLVQAERTLQQTTVSRQVGSAAEFDLLRARVARDNQRPVVIQAKSNREIAFLRLRQLLGISLTQPLTLTTSIRDEGIADSVPRPLQLNQPITMPGGDRGLVPDTSVDAPVERATGRGQHHGAGVRAPRGEVGAAAVRAGQLDVPALRIPGGRRARAQPLRRLLPELDGLARAFASRSSSAASSRATGWSRRRTSPRRSSRSTR